jgi:hypothetical protein
MFSVVYQNVLSIEYLQCDIIKGTVNSVASVWRNRVLPQQSLGAVLPPLAIETGRYSNIPVEQRLCSLCDLNVVENEMHVLLFCPLYADIRSDLYSHWCANVRNFMQISSLDRLEKFIFILSDQDIVHYTARACNQILKRRGVFTCKA